MKRTFSIDLWVMRSLALLHSGHARAGCARAQACVQRSVCCFPAGQCRISLMNSPRMLVNPK